MGRKLFTFVGTFVFLTTTFTATSGTGEVIDRIVATVNGHIILLSDWEDSLRYEAFSSGRPLDRMTADDRKSALDHLIDQVGAEAGQTLGVALWARTVDGERTAVED